MVAGAAGAAAAAAAAAYIGRRRLRVVKNPRDTLIERDSDELPVGRSADPEIDAFVTRTRPQDETSGGMLRGEYEPPGEVLADAPATNVGLDEIWNSLPGFAEGEQTEGYDAITPEDLGAVWLERATQTTHDARPHASDPNDVPQLEDLLVSDASLFTSRVDEDEGEDEYDYEEDEDREIEEDEQ